MRKYSLLVCLFIVLSLFGCGKVEVTKSNGFYVGDKFVSYGKYISVNEPNESIELRDNGTCYLGTDDFGKADDETDYWIEGESIVIKNESILYDDYVEVLEDNKMNTHSSVFYEENLYHVLDEKASLASSLDKISLVVLPVLMALTGLLIIKKGSTDWEVIRSIILNLLLCVGAYRIIEHIGGEFYKIRSIGHEHSLFYSLCIVGIPIVFWIIRSIPELFKPEKAKTIHKEDVIQRTKSQSPTNDRNHDFDDREDDLEHRSYGYRDVFEEMDFPENRRYLG